MVLWLLIGIYKVTEWVELPLTISNNYIVWPPDGSMGVNVPAYVIRYLDKIAWFKRKGLRLANCVVFYTTSIEQSRVSISHSAF